MVDHVFSGDSMYNNVIKNPLCEVVARRARSFPRIVAVRLPRTGEDFGHISNAPENVLRLDLADFGGPESNQSC